MIDERQKMVRQLTIPRFLCVGMIANRYVISGSTRDQQNGTSQEVRRTYAVAAAATKCCQATRRTRAGGGPSPAASSRNRTPRTVVRRRDREIRFRLLRARNIALVGRLVGVCVDCIAATNQCNLPRSTTKLTERFLPPCDPQRHIASAKSHVRSSSAVCLITFPVILKIIDFSSKANNIQLYFGVQLTE